jgi:transposase
MITSGASLRGGATMRAYSNDLRERIVAAVERGEYSIRQIADLFSVSLSCVVRLLQRQRRTGSVQPQPHGGVPTRKLDAAAEARLLELVKAQPDATLAELRDRLGIPCCLMTIAGALARHHITRKKKTQHAQEQQTPRVQRKRKAFQKKVAAAVDPEHLVFVDEAGATTAMTRTHGRAPRGERVQATVPGAWQNVTLIAGMRLSGVVAPIALPGAVDRAVFETYVQEALVPELQEGDVVIFDNLQPHKNPAVIAAIEAVGARVEPLPVYSPDLTPIEEMFSKTKGSLRTVAARTTNRVITAMGEALGDVTQRDILGWFHHRCAYAMP